MKVSKLIEILNVEMKSSGDFTIKEYKITIPSHTTHYYLESRKYKNKKMSLKEYLELCKNEMASKEVENE